MWCAEDSELERHVEMIADEVKERILLDEIAGAINGVAIAERLRLLSETDGSGAGASGLGVGGFVSGRDDHANFVDLRGERLFHDDAQDGFFDAIAIDEGLQREGALVFASGGDDSLSNSHGMRKAQNTTSGGWAMKRA